MQAQLFKQNSLLYDLNTVARNFVKSIVII